MNFDTQQKGHTPMWVRRLIRFMLLPWLNWKKNRTFKQAENNPKEKTAENYFLAFGKKLDDENPVSLNEKIHWLKFYSDTSMWPMLADKYSVRQYVMALF